MGDSAPIKDRRLKVVNPQKRRMPDVILHTKNVMIPIVKPVTFNQSCDTSFIEKRRQRAQNYRNNPALLFSETPLHMLYKPLENSVEVKRTSRREAKNQSTKYTIFGKNESPNSKKTSISQNSYPSKRLSRKERNNALRFPNTVLTQSEPLTDDKNLHKTSSRSIKLTRKCDLLQMKESQTRHEDISALLPKADTPISVIGKPVVSLPSRSFCDTVNTVSSVSTLSLSTSKIENKKTFANIINRAKSISNISNHLPPSSSEYEINVLHYENDSLSENNFSQFVQSHLKSTNWSSVYDCNSIKIQDDNNNLANERNAIESRTRNEGKIVNEKYSWELDNWVPPSRRKTFNNNVHEIKITERNGRSSYGCKIKYSWQVIGMSTQTSYTLLQDLLNNVEDKSAYKMCIKYSWQIIGISTQASLHDYKDPDYWSGMLLTPSKNYNGNETKIGNNVIDYKHNYKHNYTRYPEGRLKKYLTLNNQQTQTFAEKEIQADPNDCCAKYSWQDLIKQYLYGTNFRSAV